MRIIVVYLSMAFVGFLLLSRADAHSVDENFSVKEYEEFHRVLHPLQHEALPRKDFAQIRSKALELIRLGNAIVKLGVPNGTAEENTEEFRKELAKFSSSLQKFGADSKRGTNDQLTISYNSVHDSFEMLAAMLPSKKGSTPDSLSNTSTYFTFRRDLRRCASPLCGGYFVKRVNQARTRCAKGMMKNECYVAEMDWNSQPEVDERKAVIRGEMKDKSYEKRGRWEILLVTESWEAASESTSRSSTFYRVKDKGVRCITFPCPTHHGAKLNSTVSRDIAGVDLTSTGASDEAVSEANAAMTGSDGIVVVGSYVPVKGPGGRSVTLRASRFYLQRK